MQLAIERAVPADRHGIESLLRVSGLPLDGLAVALANAWVARRAGRVVGCVALELYGEAALLRSLAVAEPERGTGLGRALAGEALAAARRAGARHAILLTETAESFFARLGFEPIPRAAVPEALGASAELRGACPEGARVMRRSLEPGPLGA